MSFPQATRLRISFVLNLLLRSCASITGGLPGGRLLIGYATDRCLREPHRIDSAVKHGVNVIIWAFAHLERSEDGGLSVSPTFDVGQVRATRERLAESGAEVAHLVAFGGWNGPHPSTEASGREWFECWRSWNEVHGSPFDGVDWDLEGHDDPTAPTASLSLALVDLVNLIRTPALT